ncbi:MAG: exodeoxyribonuclease VII large subunit [Victivallaceae bacterium]
MERSGDHLIWSVSDANAAVRDLIENSLLPFWLRGEVSNLVVHRSGHVYLSLKDDKTQIRATFFNGAKMVTELNLANGALIEVHGRLTVYEVRGEYQFSIRNIRLAGLGDLQRRFEELKKKLEAEGLFDPARRKPIPALPRSIGVVTSPTGAAIRDFLQIVNRRFPNLRIAIYPAQVQGAGAAAEVARGVEFFNRANTVDVIVVTRGGGSMEDLWPFNEEILARAIAASRIPVISAVGHEIDFTIADFVADLRAPTPSAAAELVIGRREEFQNRLSELERMLNSTLDYRLMAARSKLNQLAGSSVLQEPAHLLAMRSQELDELEIRMEHYFEKFGLAQKTKLDALAGRLEILNPRRQLERGYAILTKAGAVLTSAAAAKPGDELEAALADGALKLEVK